MFFLFLILWIYSLFDRYVIQNNEWKVYSLLFAEGLIIICLLLEIDFNIIHLYNFFKFELIWYLITEWKYLLVYQGFLNWRYFLF